MRPKWIDDLAKADVSAAIHRDEILRTVSQQTGIYVFLGWFTCQFLTGGYLYFFTTEKITGLTLQGFAFAAGFVWVAVLGYRRVFAAAKESILKTDVRRRATLYYMAIFQGVWMAVFMTAAYALWLHPERSIQSNLFVGLGTGILTGLFHWLLLGKLFGNRSREEHRP